MTKLKNIRTAKGLKQRELAELSGVNVRLIQDYEQGHKNINTAKAISVYQLSEALGCSVRDLLELNDSEKG